MEQRTEGQRAPMPGRPLLETQSNGGVQSRPRGQVSGLHQQQHQSDKSLANRFGRRTAEPSWWPTDLIRRVPTNRWRYDRGKGTGISRHAIEADKVSLDRSRGRHGLASEKATDGC